MTKLTHKEESKQRIVDRTDSFLNELNIGDPDSTHHRRGFEDPQDVVYWFYNERSDDWRQRD